jgi:hypothetical protein
MLSGSTKMQSDPLFLFVVGFADQNALTKSSIFSTFSTSPFGCFQPFLFGG